MSRLDQYSKRPYGTSSRSQRRSVPLSTKLAAYFGGFFPQFGAAFFTFGMIFWWFFGANADITSWYKFSGELAHTDGRVVACESTGASEGGSKSTPGTPIYRIDYEYLTPSELKLSGTCYGTGMSFPPGAAVDVEYVPDDPATSRIVTSRKKIFGPWPIFVAIFPLVGLVLMMRGLLSNARAARVLSVGKLTRGVLVDKQATTTRINNQPVYELTFEFEDEHGRTYRISTKTHKTAALEDEPTERLLYDPDNPEQGALVDNLPGRPEVTEGGELKSVGMGPALLRMLLPVGGIAGHALVGVILYVV
ncbi:MAG: DUF3592 domain-containing protein [Planctomycetes bacterium]|nr:DUF3592 domain-containing protein [Planctomycetota bacterium]